MQLDEDIKRATVPYTDHKLRPSGDGSGESDCGVGNIPIRKPSILKRTILSWKLPKQLSIADLAFPLFFSLSIFL